MISFEQIRDKENATIKKTIHRFSLTTSVFSLFSSLFYFFIGLLYPAVIVLAIGCLFLFIVYLNKKSNQNLARVIAIITTNLGVLFFSPYIGFDGGIYLYIFVAPQLIFLLFKRQQKKLIYFCMALNFVTSIFIFLIHRYDLIESTTIDSDYVQLLYNVNFMFSLIFSFILTAIFAKNNDIYIEMLVDANQSLNNQQEILILEIAEKNNMNLALEKSVKEKEVLLSEVHHRVKNNLAVISSLLELENLFVKEKTVSDILKDSKNRIKSIALLHEKLYQHQNFDKIDIQNYIKELIHFIELSYSSEQKNISIKTDLDPIFLTMELALPFSLLINELITNSYKHAFVGRDRGLINIRLKEHNEEICLSYTDDGVGFDIHESIHEDSIGMNLLTAFIGQLEGELENNTTKGDGCNIILHFKDI